MAEAVGVKVESLSPAQTTVKREPLVVGKPPWSEIPHTGGVERLILQLGSGKGKFDEISGIPRSIGCIGNNRFLLRRKKLTPEEVTRILGEFKSMGGNEVWITNYDGVEDLQHAVRVAVDLGIQSVNATVLFEDLDGIEPIEGVNYIAEVEYDVDKIISASMKLWVGGLLVTVPPDRLQEATVLLQKVKGDSDLEVYLDVLYPRSVRELTFNLIEVRKNRNETSNRYHDCLAGTVTVTGDGYVTPCPLLRNFVVGDVREKSLRWIVGRSKKIRGFWTLTKNEVEGCSTCPFRYLCHDCRAIEYQVTADIRGIEYCPLIVSSEAQNSRIE